MISNPDPQSSITDPQSSIPKRRRGGQKGNTNALKHGFYTSRFDIHELTDLDDLHPSGLKDEILILRLYTRRLIDQSTADLSFQERYITLRLLCLACHTLTRMLKVQNELNQSGQDEFNRNVNAALDQLAIEWHLNDPDPDEPLSPDS